MTFQNNQIDMNSLPSVMDMEMISIERNYYKVMLINNLIKYISIIVILFFVYFFNTKFDWNRFFPWIVGILIIGILFHAYAAKIGFKNRKYALRDHDISYTEGWLFSKYYTVPFVRTQHVEIRQGFVSKFFNLSNIKVFTAGAGDDVYIKGLRTETAEEIRNFIISKINGKL
ncbi:PH domain-containing protein [Aureibaculum marinum]|uniref:PH domain-containing protein n=1 Tax=Aureibaculum marinum TaxID=2487930 RepID=A0A3N4P0Y8_9FLAO|nr:PH domain-containing protein [Aureibaculum marinum]RPD98666.1 PH domain-containing protein [Aureibaculum marinum]